MRAFKGILLTGTAIVALAACSSDKGPGAIGSVDDIVVRNRGEKAVPPPEPVKEVKIADAVTGEGEAAAAAPAAEGAEPTASAMIAAEDTGVAKPVDAAAAAPEQTTAPEEQAADVEVAAAEVTPDTAPSMNWNQPRRIETPEEADKLVSEQEATQAAPVAAAAPAAPAPSEPPAADVAAAQAVPVPAPAEAAAPAAAPTPLIPVVAPENYTQDPDAPFSPAAARAAAAAQTGTPSDASADAAATGAVAPMTLAKADGPMPLDPAVLQAKDVASIKSLQKTLADAGYYKGAVNGVMDSNTLNAYVKYQSAAQANVPAAAPVAETPAAEATVAADAPAPTPVMDQAPVAEVAPAPAPMTEAPAMPVEQPAAPAPQNPDAPTMTETPFPMDAKIRSPRALVSRRTPKELAPVEPARIVEKRAPVPAAAAAPAPTPSPATISANASMSDPAVISATQRALTAKGLYTGPANGAMDADTLNALVRYQAANNLVPGMLNVETLRSLGVVAQ